jgi:hypothetical protein
MYFHRTRRCTRKVIWFFALCSNKRARKADPENTLVGCFPVVAFSQKSEPIGGAPKQSGVQLNSAFAFNFILFPVTQLCHFPT